ncbi:MAG: SMEK domain-containing protein, partial [Atopobiaceae bacterium]|nr:SMEK domain-containing protein [Atopobiaceae bacterium]
MIEGDHNTNMFNAALRRLNGEIKTLSRLNLQSQAVHAEDFFMRLLNALYGWGLANANWEDDNHQAVDLVDEGGRLVVQVTASCTRDKVRETLAKKAMAGYAADGYRVKFVFVGEQDPGAMGSSDIPNGHGVTFDQGSDLLFTEGLVKRFSHLPPSEQRDVLTIVDEALGDGGRAALRHIGRNEIAAINVRLEKRRAYHPSFRLMGGVGDGRGIDERLLPKGLEVEQIPNAARTVVPDGGAPVRFGEFVKASWESGGQCHLLITGEGGIGKTVALLPLATEEGFLPRSTAAVYVPLYELAQYCGDGEGADRDCVDRFVEKDFPDGKEALAAASELANRPWSGGPSLILLMDGYNEVPVERHRAVDAGVSKWASWPGVQVITTSREVSLYDVPHMRKLELQGLSREAVSAYLGVDAPDESDERLWRLLETPLMLRLYAGSKTYDEGEL